MNLKFNSSLEHIVIVKIASILLSNQSVTQLKNKPPTSSLEPSILYNFFKIKYLPELENILVEKIHRIELPVTLTNKLICMIRVMLGQIYNYGGFHLHNTFLWTPEGIIDRVGMIRRKVEDNSKIIVERFKLACEYCLENEIRVLWEQLEPHDMISIRNNTVRPIRFWVIYMEGRLEEIRDEITTYCENANAGPYEYMFLLSAVCGNESAARSFFKRLRTGSGEDIDLLMLAVRNIVSKYDLYGNTVSNARQESAVLCFLLSQMDQNQRDIVFKKYSSYVLNFFLDWPWLTFFIDVSREMLGYIHSRYYVDTLYMIFERIHDVTEDYIDRKLLQEFWLQAPSSLQSYVLEEFSETTYILSGLLWLGDRESIKCFLSVATPAEKLNIICSSIWFPILDRENTDMIQFFIRECISSERDFREFEVRVMEHAQRTGSTNLRNRLNNYFFEFFNTD